MSLTQIVPGSRLHMRYLQLALNRFGITRTSRSWFLGTISAREILSFGGTSHIFAGVCLRSVLQDLFFSDVSDDGWDAYVSDRLVSVLWNQEDSLSTSLQELRTIRLGLESFCRPSACQVLGVFCYDTTVVAHLRNQRWGGRGHLC